MKALQRLQQQILGRSHDIPRNFEITPKASRLYDGLRKSIYISIATAGVIGATALLGTGMQSYDPNSLYLGDKNSSLVQHNIYDKHYQLLAAREDLHELRRLIAESGDSSEDSIRQLVKDLGEAKSKVKGLELDYSLLTKDMTNEEIKEIVGDDSDVTPPAPALKFKS